MTKHYACTVPQTIITINKNDDIITIWGVKYSWLKPWNHFIFTGDWKCLGFVLKKKTPSKNLKLG